MAVEQRPQLLARRFPHTRPDELVRVGVGVFAAYQIALALFMVIAPHAFFSKVGPFGTRNDHYIRDTATFSAALGLGLAIAVRRPSWRVPMLTVTAAQFILHSVNHLVDIDSAHPAWTGYFDFFSLAAASVLLLWLLRLAVTGKRVFFLGAKGAKR